MNTEDVAQTLRRAIRLGVLKPGEVLVQEEIADRLGVSRVPLREALRGLAAVGLVQTSPGRGFRVTELDADEIGELYGLRLRIEPALAPRIISQASAPLIRDLCELEERMRQTDDPEEWANCNYEFHLRMYEAPAGNHSHRMARQLLDLVEPYSRFYVYELDNRDRVQAEHSSMMGALDSGDEWTLSSMIQTHLEGARKGLTELMSKREEVVDPLHRLAGLGGST